MRLQTLSSNNKKRDRPSSSNTVEQDGSSPSVTDTVKNPSSLSIKVEDGSGLIRPPPLSKDATDSKRQSSRSRNRKQSSNHRSDLNHAHAQSASSSSQQQHDNGKNNNYNNRNTASDHQGYRKNNRAKTKTNTNPGGSHKSSYSTSKTLGHINYGDIPVLSWIVILSLLGFTFYHLRKIFQFENRSSSSSSRSSSSTSSNSSTSNNSNNNNNNSTSSKRKHPWVGGSKENYKSKDRRMNQTTNHKEDLHPDETLLMLQSEVVNKKKQGVVKSSKRSTTAIKSSREINSKKLDEKEKLFRRESSDSALTDASSTGSAIKSSSDGDPFFIDGGSTVQVLQTSHLMEPQVPVIHESSRNIDENKGEWCKAKSKSKTHRKNRKNSTDDDDVPKSSIDRKQEPPKLVEDGSKTQMLEEKTMDVFVFETNETMISLSDKTQTAMNVILPAIDKEGFDQEKIQESTSKSSLVNSLSMDSDHLLASMLQSQEEEASVLRYDNAIHTVSVEHEWEEVLTKKKKRG